MEHDATQAGPETGPRSANPMIGRLLDGRYKVVSLAGEGAMGAVYRARHTFMNIDVAVKTLHHELTSNEELVERFHREAQAAAHIAHPNVCAATDFGQVDDGTFFLVMEWLEGPSLEKLLADHLVLPPERAIHIAAQIADALVRAHELEIIHRDLKPANILIIEEDGNPDFVKVTDFGVARVRIGNAAKITQAGIAYGTPSYMSPEQASALEDIDTRADLYSLGIILYEMLTGAVPFQGSGIAQVLAMQVTEQPKPILEVAPTTPPELAELVMQCLEKSPDDRPSTAEEVGRRLRAIDTTAETTADTGANDAALPEPVAPVTAVATTAPQGQTPTASTTSRSKPSWLPLALGIIFAGALLAVSVGYFAGNVMSDGSSENAQVTLAEERAEFSKQPEIASALQAQAAGDETAALKAFQSAQLNYETNAHYQFLLASALFQNGDAAAFDAFGRAISIDKRYAHEEGLRKAVVEGVFEKALSEKAVAFLTTHDDEDYRDALYTAVMNAEKRRDRERALEILKETKAWEKLPEWSRLSAELVSTRKCSDLEPLVVKAIEADDDRLKEAVKQLTELPKRGCGFLKRSDCYDCARDKIAEAAKLYGLVEEQAPKP